VLGVLKAPPLFVNSFCANLLLVIEAMSTSSDITPTHILLFWYCRSMAKQLSLLSYVKTPNLARNNNSETAAGESTVGEEKDKGDEDWRISKVTRKVQWRI